MSFRQAAKNQKLRRSDDSQKSLNQETGEYTEIFSWGSDRCGQLGLGEDVTSFTLKLVPRLCSYRIAIQTLSCGAKHSAFITVNNLVYTMGSNTYGQLGLGDKKLDLKQSPQLVEPLVNQKCIKVACG